MFPKGLSKYLKSGRKLVEHRTNLSQENAGPDDKCETYNGMANQLEVWRAYSSYAKNGLIRTKIFRRSGLIMVILPLHYEYYMANGVPDASQYFISKLGLDKPRATY